ncbi:hypothetical protein [Corynebacterium kalidii]
MSTLDKAPSNTIDEQLDQELNEAALEAALPSLTEKLQALKDELTQDEAAVLSSIVTTSAVHLKSLHDVNERAEYIFAKPISAAATPAIRSQLLSMPEKLGFTEK